MSTNAFPNSLPLAMTNRPWRLALLLAALAVAPGTWADGGSRMPAPVLPAYTQECGACHAAFPPGMLPAASWQRLMAGLGRHYGTDASLEAATARPLEAWLLAHAGTYKRVREEPPQDRITRSAWFERKHREVAASTWKLPSVKSAANCAACHPGTDRGVFSEHELRMPAGPDAPARRARHD
jgi:hypothetical protein